MHLYRLMTALVFLSLVLPAPASSAEFRCIRSYSQKDMEIFKKNTVVMDMRAGIPDTKVPICYVLMLEGEIENGDNKKLITLLKNLGHWVHTLSLNSPGGEAIEAQKIGWTVRKALLETSAPHMVVDGNGNPVRVVGGFGFPEGYCKSKRCSCNSACFIVWVAGIERSGNAVGIHRAYFEKKYFAGLSPEEAQNNYQTLTQHLEKYLLHMEVPKIYLEKMKSVPSNEMFYLWEDRTGEWSELRWERPPSIYEWLRASCGALTEKEKMIVMRVNFFLDYEDRPPAVRALVDRKNEISVCEKRRLYAERKKAIDEL